ncbi:hypothetical protein SLEP1_g1470 [Rubroshorea leprosula]|uniref:Uncharacterized protein n=1 Tax=Rubroshorea leprosula TaxID=152421 RepID=A0AAV5HDV8_9ROSI|nr:hypothetical protein SLEP1_g1470 [Rubroshorea leprosula]
MRAMAMPQERASGMFSGKQTSGYKSIVYQTLLTELLILTLAKMVQPKKLLTLKEKHLCPAVVAARSWISLIKSQGH